KKVADEIAFVADGVIEAHGQATAFFEMPATPRLAGFLETVLA
ncbi:MAG: amino acid ABC transporter ATP-binding protein, partial [Pirellulales bacterium]|nr:amino acid ABC transporter ATP-binding protein [Pirellulales bacterium]